MLHVIAEPDLESQRLAHHSQRLASIEKKRLPGVSHELTVAELYERRSPAGHDAWVSVLNGFGIEDVGPFEVFQERANGPQATSHQAIVIAEHDEVVAAAVLEGAVPVFREGEHRIRTNVPHARFTKRGYESADVLGRRVVCNDDLPLAVVLLENAPYSQPEEVEPVSSREQDREFHTRFQKTN